MIKPDLKQKILDASQDGLNIITYYYPQSQGCEQSKNKKFKIREESTASASLYRMKSGLWVVTDFGDDGVARNCFDVAMQHENMTFTEVLHLWAGRLGVSNSINAEINKPKIEKRPATKDEPNGTFRFEEKPFTEDELAVLGPTVKQETVDKYGYVSLKWYSTTKKDEETKKLFTTTITANENFPIFMRKCKHDDSDDIHYKVYKPLSFKKEHRFLFSGTLPKNYINGMVELENDYNEWVEQQEADNEETGKREKIKKLPEVLLCSGERDALCAAGMGYKVLWLNSETADIAYAEFSNIMRFAEKVYNVPDIDETGLNRAKYVALKFLDVYTVMLPSYLLNFRDNRGKQRKDLRDYLEIRPLIKDFDELLKQAKPCKFWQYVPARDGMRLEINTLYFLHFLKQNGFYKVKQNEDISYIKIDGNVVSTVTQAEIRDFARSFLAERKVAHEVQNVFINSKRTSNNIALDLDFIELDLRDYTFDSQILHFQNTSVQVFADDLKLFRKDSKSGYVKKERIIQHNFKRTEPSFTVDYSGHQPVVHVGTHNSNVFNVMINASRLYWREEFENRTDENEEFNLAYRKRFRYSVTGDRLTTEEIEEQQLNLTNKLFSIGYIMHAYKEASRAWALWIMENKITDENESNGGSGKSFFMRFITPLKEYTLIDVSKKESVEKNNYVFDTITDKTQIALCEDCDRYINFRTFFQYITDPIKINPKHRSGFVLPFNKSPKFAYTSNYPPSLSDGSALRRLLFVVFSDYYHEKGSSYAESVSIRDDFDFNFDIFSENYPAEMWNADYNFLIDCMQFYLLCKKKNLKKINPPMNNVMNRFDISQMGDIFRDWADIYFSEEGENLNTLINKDEAYTNFRETTRSNFGTRKFKEALKAYCRFNKRIIALNPRELCGQDGRIIKKINGKACEMIYIQTVPLSETHTAPDPFKETQEELDF